MGHFGCLRSDPAKGEGPCIFGMIYVLSACGYMAQARNSLAGQAPPPHGSPSEESVSQALQQILDDLDPAPAHVMGRRWDYEELIEDLKAVSPEPLLATEVAPWGVPPQSLPAQAPLTRVCRTFCMYCQPVCRRGFGRLEGGAASGQRDQADHLSPVSGLWWLSR
jgi:hypothetical protein